MKTLLKILFICIASIFIFIVGVFGLALILTILDYSPFSAWYKIMGISGDVTIWQMFLIGLMSIGGAINLSEKVFKNKEDKE